jgi:hypothetical protein
MPPRALVIAIGLTALVACSFPVEDFRVDAGARDSGSSTTDSAFDGSSDAPSDGPDTGGCPVGRLLCKGVCVDTTLDDNNCGACGFVCDGGNRCRSSKCVGG